MEKEDSNAAQHTESAKTYYASNQCNEIVSSCWLDSTRRHCLPSVVRRQPSGDRRSPTQRVPLTTSEDSTKLHPISTMMNNNNNINNMNNMNNNSISSNNAKNEDSLLALPIPAHINGPLDILEPPPTSTEPPHKLRISLAHRWRPYASGAIRRYDVPARVYLGPKDTNNNNNNNNNSDNSAQSPYRSIAELAQQAEKAEGRVPRDVFAPTAAPLRQVVVRVTDIDPRVIASEQGSKSNVNGESNTFDIPAELRKRKMFFEATLGAVKPYALGENRNNNNNNNNGRRRVTKPGQNPPSMPPSALTRDPMEVFVEAMRFQRPALGVYSFDVY